MRIIYPSLLVLLISSCDNGSASNVTIDTSTKTEVISLKTAATYARLLEKFPPVSFDTLGIEGPGISDANSPFNGHLLDNHLTELLPKEISRHNYSYAISQFPLDADNTGLIARVPGEYESSAVVLLIYNHSSNTLKFGAELADTWGDAGDVEEKWSWLIRTTGQPLQKLLVRYTAHDNSVDNEKDTTMESSTDYFLLYITAKGEDTVQKDNPTLLGMYGHLLNRE